MQHKIQFFVFFGLILFILISNFQNSIIQFTKERIKA